MRALVRDARSSHGAVDGPLASVRGEDLYYDGAAEHFQAVWIVVRAGLTGVMDALTLPDVAAGPSRRA